MLRRHRPQKDAIMVILHERKSGSLRYVCCFSVHGKTVDEMRKTLQEAIG